MKKIKEVDNSTKILYEIYEYDYHWLTIILLNTK